MVESCSAKDVGQTVTPFRSVISFVWIALSLAWTAVAGFMLLGAVLSLIRGPLFEGELWGAAVDDTAESSWGGWLAVGLALAYVMIGALSIWSALRAQSRWGMLPNTHKAPGCQER